MIKRDYTDADILIFRNRLVMTATKALDNRPRSLDELQALVAKHNNTCYELILSAVMSVEPTLSFNEFKFKSLTAVVKTLTTIMNGKSCCDTALAVTSRRDMLNHILRSIR